MTTSLLFLLLWSSSASLAQDPVRTWALVEQEELPRAAARKVAADAKVKARRDFAGGRAPFASAYPGLSASDLGDEHLLRGRLGLLDDAAVARAEEGLQAPPEANPAQLASWRKAWTATWEAEELADELERRMLLQLLAGLKATPALSRTALALERQPFLDRVDEARRAVEAAAPEALADAQRDLARAEEDLARLEQLVFELRLTAAGGRPPDVELELARVEAGERGEGLITRLHLVRPFLDGDGARRVDDVLASFWAARRADAEATLKAAQEALAADPAELPTEQVAQSARDEAQARLERLRARVDDLSPDDTTSDPRRGVLALRVAAQEFTLQRAERTLALVKADASREAERALTEAQEAQQKAEQARAAAEDARDRRVATLLEAFAASQARASELVAAVDGAKQELATAQGWANTLAETQAAVERVQQMSALDNRGEEADRTYLVIRDLLGAMRESDLVRGVTSSNADTLASQHLRNVEADRQDIAEAEAFFLEQLDGQRRGEVAATLATWSERLTWEAEHIATLANTVQEARDLALSTLHDARLARRTLSDYISREQRDADRANLIVDIAQEVSLLPPSVMSMLRSRRHDLVEMVSGPADFNVLRRLFLGSFWTLVLGVAWWAARARAPRLSLQAAQQVRRWRPELRVSDVAALRDPMGRFLRNTIDLALGYSLVWSLGETLKEISFLLLVYLQLSLYRVLLAGFDLAVVTRDEVRPAAVALRPEVRALARRTLQWFSGFFIVRSFARFVAWDVLGTDTIASMLEWLLGWGLWALVGWALWRWQPHLRDRIAPSAKAHAVVAWLAQDDGSVVFRIPRALGCLGFFAARGAVDLTYRVARDGSSLAWLLNLVNRYRLSSEEPLKAQTLSDELRQRIVDARTEEVHLLQRDEVTLEMSTAFSEWQKTHRRGLVALVGDRGSGKATACGHAQELFEAAGLPVVRARLQEHVTRDTEILAWLASVLGLEGTYTSSEELAQAVEELEPRGIIVQGIHRAFARRVGGLQAISTLLYVLNATSDRHFWVASVHAPAWDWFDSIGSLVDTGVFQVVIRLPPMSSQQLRALTVARMGSMGLTVDFSGLVRASAFGADPEVELERSTSVFYRLLAEACSGNPTLAMHAWARCLTPTDDEHVVRVRMSTVLSGGVLEQVSEPALFVLVALRLQDVLSLDEIVEVTNLAPAVVRTTVRDLLSRALLEWVETDVTLRIPDENLQVVTRTLRRRHFLHLGSAT